MDVSNVEVTAGDIEALREFLTEDGEDSTAFLDVETGAMTLVGGVLLNAAFGVLVRRRFSPTYTIPQVIEYVRDLRTMLGEGPVAVNPRVAENMIRDVLGDPTLEAREPYGADEEAMAVAAVAIVTDLFHAAKLDGPELDRFLRDSADYARNWLDAYRATSGA